MTLLTVSDLARSAFDDILGGDGPNQLALARQVEPGLIGLSLPALIEIARDAEVPLNRQDGVFGAVVRSYRRGPRSIWGAILLEMLAPAIGGAELEVVSWEPVNDEEDLHQQAVLEALSAADQMPLWGDRWLKRRIEFRVRIALLRWSAGQFPLASAEAPLDREAPDVIGLFDLLDVMGCVLTPQEFTLVYRSTVLREELVELAQEMGSTFDAVRMKRARALRRLRPHAA
jgi:hypothetical protein